MMTEPLYMDMLLFIILNRSSHKMTVRRIVYRPCLIGTVYDCVTKQIRTIDRQRLRDYIGMVTEEQIVAVNHAIVISLGLNQTLREPIELSLCSICVNQFYQTQTYRIKRVDKEQKHKES